MLTENILDQSHPESTQFADCKIQYLLAQNKLMTVQLNSISTLVQKYKKIIDLLSKNKSQNQSELENEQKKESPNHKNQLIDVAQQIRNILGESEKIVENCVQECKDISSSKRLFQDDQGTITPAFFAELVLSYEKTIAELKHSIHQRQILLQQLESTPKHPMKRITQQPAQSSAVIKAIQSYDIYPKISQKCRKQILFLKQKKNELKLNKYPKISQSNITPNNTGLSITNEFDKTLKKPASYYNSQINFEDRTQVEAESMSPFEKTILIYKKKKIFNDILEAKVLDLKKKIKQKEEYNKILKKKLENQVWDNIQNMGHCGRNLEEDDPAYLSMLNQSLRANNLDFSVDISRVIPNCHKNQTNVNLHNILEEVNQETQRYKNMNA